MNYIKNGLRKGISIAQLKEEIGKKGYPEKDAREAINSISKNNSMIFLAAGISIILIIAAIFIFMPRVKIIEIPVPFENVVSGDVESLRYHLVEKDIRWVANVVSCEAVVSDNESKCNFINNSISRQWCIADYNDYKAIVADIEKYSNIDCSTLKDEAGEGGLVDEEICRAVQEKSCIGLTGSSEAICSAILVNASRCLEFSNEDCERYFTERLAISKNDENLCSNKNLGIGYSEACRGIIRKDCNDLFNRISMDLSIISYVRQENNYEKCSLIKTEELKALCSDKSLSYMDVYSLVK
ncbi:MAG: hypothetical protein V1886_00675 [archaeon]